MATSGYPAWVRTNPSVLYSLVPSYLAGTSPADDCSCRTIRIYLCQVWLLESRLGFLDFFWKSWMRSSKGSRFTLGVWGLRVCSLDVAQPSATVRNRPQPSATVRNRLQPFATVRNRSRDPRMAVPMASSAEGVIFGGFKRRVASFRVAGVALRDIQMCFVTRRKSFSLAGAILWRRFRKKVAVFVAGAALWTCPASFCVAGAAL